MDACFLVLIMGGTIHHKEKIAFFFAKHSTDYRHKRSQTGTTGYLNHLSMSPRGNDMMLLIIIDCLATACGILDHRFTGALQLK